MTANCSTYEMENDDFSPHENEIAMGYFVIQVTTFWHFSNHLEVLCFKYFNYLDNEPFICNQK